MSHDSSPEVWHDSPEIARSPGRAPKPQHPPLGRKGEARREEEGMTGEQVGALEKLWAETTSPSLDQGMNLAFEQKLKPNQIQDWFARRRLATPKATTPNSPLPPLPAIRSVPADSLPSPVQQKLTFPGPPSGARKPRYATYAYTSPDCAPGTIRELLGIQTTDDDDPDWTVPGIPPTPLLHVLEAEFEEASHGRTGKCKGKGKGKEVAEDDEVGAEDETEVEAEEVLTGEVAGADEVVPVKVGRSDSVVSLGSLASIAEEGIPGTHRHQERRSSVRSIRSTQAGRPAPFPSGSVFPSGPRTRRTSVDTTHSTSSASISPAATPYSPSKASVSSSTRHSSSRPDYSATSSPASRAPHPAVTQATTPSNASIMSGTTGRRYAASVHSNGTAQSTGPQSIFASIEPRKRGMAELLAAVANKPPPLALAPLPVLAPAPPKQSRLSKFLGGGRKPAAPAPGSSLSMFGPRPGGSASILDAALMSAQAGGARVRGSNMSLYHQQKNVHPDALAEALARSGVRQPAPSIMSVDSDGASSFHGSHRHRRGSDDRSERSAVAATFPSARKQANELVPPVPELPSGVDRSTYTSSTGGPRVAPSKRAPVFATRADAVFVQKKGINEGPSRRSFTAHSGDVTPAGLGLGLAAM